MLYYGAMEITNGPVQAPGSEQIAAASWIAAARGAIARHSGFEELAICVDDLEELSGLLPAIRSEVARMELDRTQQEANGGTAYVNLQLARLPGIMEAAFDAISAAGEAAPADTVAAA